MQVKHHHYLHIIRSKFRMGAWRPAVVLLPCFNTPAVLTQTRCASRDIDDTVDGAPVQFGNGGADCVVSPPPVQSAAGLTSLSPTCRKQKLQAKLLLNNLKTQKPVQALRGLTILKSARHKTQQVPLKGIEIESIHRCSP